MNENTSEKKHFVLIHGFCHGAWCWYKAVSLLKHHRHRVTALDLAGCGVHSDQLHQISSLSDYIRPLMEFMSSLSDNDKVILVGHSYGGIPISLAMEKYPAKVSAAVFITAYMPNCPDPPATLVQEYFKRCSAESFMDCELKFDPSLENLPISANFGPDFMAAKLYRGCPSEDLELGKMLIRPNSFFLEDMKKKSLLSQERYGKIKRYYVVCEGDEVLDSEFQSYIIEKNPPEEVISIAGADHMVMLSKPQEQCTYLMALAEKF